jgi:hypothetical protein
MSGPEKPGPEKTAPKVETVTSKPLTEKEQKKAKLLEQCQGILKEYDGLESNIPLQHEYWTLMNQYRGQ